MQFFSIIHYYRTCLWFLCIFNEIYVSVFDRELSKVGNVGKMGSIPQKLSDQPPYRFLIISKNDSFGDGMCFHLPSNMMLWLNLVKFYPPPPPCTISSPLDRGGGGVKYMLTPLVRKDVLLILELWMRSTSLCMQFWLLGWIFILCNLVYGVNRPSVHFYVKPLFCWRGF